MLVLGLLALAVGGLPASWFSVATFVSSSIRRRDSSEEGAAEGPERKAPTVGLLHLINARSVHREPALNTGMSAARCRSSGVRWDTPTGYAAVSPPGRRWFILPISGKIYLPIVVGPPTSAAWQGPGWEPTSAGDWLPSFLPQSALGQWFRLDASKPFVRVVRSWAKFSQTLG